MRMIKGLANLFIGVTQGFLSNPRPKVAEVYSGVQRFGT